MYVSSLFFLWAVKLIDTISLLRTIIEADGDNNRAFSSLSGVLQNRCTSDESHYTFIHNYLIDLVKTLTQLPFKSIMNLITIIRYKGSGPKHRQGKSFFFSQTVCERCIAAACLSAEGVMLQVPVCRGAVLSKPFPVMSAKSVKSSIVMAREGRPRAMYKRRKSPKTCRNDVKDVKDTQRNR